MLNLKVTFNLESSRAFMKRNGPFISASLAIRIAEQSAYATEESLIPSVGPHM